MRSGARRGRSGWIGAGLMLAVLVGAPWTVAAQPRVDDPEGLETPRGLALGTGVRASAASTSALAYNTANLSAGQLYHVEGFTGYEPRVGRWIVGANVVDSMTSRLAMGFSFRGVLSDGDRGYSGYDGKLGAGFPLSDMISVGLAGRFVSLDHEGPNYPSLGLAKGDTRVRHFTMDGAVRVTPTPGLNVAALAFNFVDARSSLVPILVGGSVAFTVGDGLSFGADALTDLTTFDSAKVLAGGGIEYLAAGQVPIRLGYRFDQGREVHAVTGGVGFVSQQLGLDFGLQQQVVVPDGWKAATELMVSFRYFVQ